MTGFTALPRTVDERLQRPKVFAPAAVFGSVVEASAAFRGARQKTIEYVQQTQADLRRLRVMHPAAGSIDVYQNLLIGAYHPERHAKQIEEIKSDEAYPT